jgi:hypothetical protein
MKIFRLLASYIFDPELKLTVEISNSLSYIEYEMVFSIAERGLVCQSMWKYLPNVSSSAPTRYFVNNGIDDFTVF